MMPRIHIRITIGVVKAAGGPVRAASPCMEAHKRDHYFNKFNHRLGRNEQALHRYRAFLINKEQDIRRFCHLQNEDDEFRKFDNNEDNSFVDMVFYDPVSIMELFLGHQYRDDDASNPTWRLLGIQRDMLLLENQLPLFVLQELHRSVVHPVLREHSSFFDLARDHFHDNFLDAGSSARKIMNAEEMRQQKHLTDFIRYFYVPDRWSVPKPGKCQCSGVFYSAKKLNKALVCFEAVDSGKCLLDIEFKKGFLCSRQF
ncbi:uncharacterized protein LOC114727843 [Neltuma alba]|uniref:uncharacterized protein LOC114727843 n=1 Tax=Neltuma alba TaxID=207710 RepID=UPI0010A4E547|nr:uncharacterized protein LOC114727843 [Prosopis alba]